MNKIKKYIVNKAISSMVDSKRKQKDIEKQMVILAIKHKYYETKINIGNWFYRKANHTNNNFIENED